jgi:hypothetical protein
VKKTLLTGIAALFLATGTAHAAPTMLPPLEYDYSYDGELKFIIDLDRDAINRMCGPKTSVACILGGGKLSITYTAKECWIALVRQEEAVMVVRKSLLGFLVPEIFAWQAGIDDSRLDIKARIF